MIFQLNLETGVPSSPPGKIFYLPYPEKPYKLRLSVDATSPLCQGGVVHTNNPPQGSKFDRNKFYDHEIKGASLTGDSYVELEIFQSGSYAVYTSYYESTGTYGEITREKAETKKWNFVVSTELKIGDKPLTPNELCVQTVLSKLMGPYDSWGKKLEAIKGKGYNMIHFVPLNQRGESDSPFSIYDQLAWDPKTFPHGEDDIADLTHTLETKYGILSLSDVVLNHTANNSKWLQDHPEVGYTGKTAPWLLSAIELDNTLLSMSEELSKKGTEIHNWDDVQGVVQQVGSAIDALKLWEYYVMDVDCLERTVTKTPFEGRPPSGLPSDLKSLGNLLAEKGSVNWDTLGPRFHRRVETSLLAEYVAGSSFSARQIIDELNDHLYKEYNADRATILNEIGNRMKYLRLDSHGPQWGTKISKKFPIAEPYFTHVKAANGIVEMANNGWVWAANPMVDFAGAKSKAYLTRQVIIWGDCVKLRYGEGPQSCPYLWERMTDYVQLLARHFAGLRIDNCHSTPIHVGRYLMDKARLVRPDIYIVAELFSGSEEIDKMYVEEMGITSLLREAIQPNTPRELSTQINVNGGLPVGSFIMSEVLECEIVKVEPSPIHAWLMECTHDNETFAQKRTVEDTLSTAALVAMTMTASGCTVGSDECYPKGLNIVTESREYVFGGGISDAKRALNEIHRQLGAMNAFESFTHFEGQYITVHRLNPETGEGYYTIARTKFHPEGDQEIGPTFLEGTKAEWFKGWKITCTGSADDSPDSIGQIPVEVDELKPFNIEFDGQSTWIHHATSKGFPQGSVAVFKTSRTFDAKSLEALVREGHEKAIADLDILQLSTLLYKIDGEERGCTEGTLGTYTIPGHGSTIYAGIQGWESILRNVVKNNDLGSAICDNLREGAWAFESLLTRAEYYKLDSVAEWLRARLDLIRTVPSFLRPRYFAAIVLGLYDAAVERAMSLFPDHIGDSQFMTSLSLVSLQMISALPGASLISQALVPSMAAGLPHFACGYMRCWGRDVFLSLSGLCIRTNRIEEAKSHILGFAATLKHGLIPNLLDSGKNPRYNARDAVWFWLQSIQEYCEHVGSYEILNEKVKRRFPKDDTFVEWDSPEAFSYETTLSDMIVEVLERHAKVIEFREHNAGTAIDSQMKDNGFNQKIWVDWDNGLVFGGNQDNCGTWMDKMGESAMAGNKGVPGTPRDGAAVEITGLLKSCLRWICSLHDAGKFKFSSDGVENQHGKFVSFKEWDTLIQKNFEKTYYVPKNPEDDKNYDVDPKIINRRGIYKDLYRSGKPYEDYQLRPNFCIAVVVAPELFDTTHAVNALSLADEALDGPIGMATLDPSDLNYRPYYENNVENTDFATSKGRNYHQGPEWVWCKGVFLQALAIIDRARSVPREDTIATIRARIQGDVKWIRESQWAGLTELTQKNGQFCADSSPTQAWSAARLLDAIVEIYK